MRLPFPIPFFPSTNKLKDSFMNKIIQYQNWAVLGFVAVGLFFLMGFIFNPSHCFATMGQSATLSKDQKRQLVEEGVTLYKEGKIVDARKTLEEAKLVFPENFAVPYFLGLIYLKEENYAGAISEWRRYVALNPDSKETLIIRKSLTLLLREEAKNYARMAVANEASLTIDQVAENTVAVTAFKNVGSDRLGPLGKGLAAILIHDLSQVPDLKVIERVKVQILLEEINLGTSGIVDPDTAPQVGRLLKAGYMTSGSLADTQMETLYIASAVINMHQDQAVRTQEAQGPMEKFYRLEKELACQIIQGVGKNCDNVPKKFKKIHTKSMPALIAYSWGLDYIDKQQYDQARDEFQKAIEADPDFELAKSALLAVPLAHMSLASLSNTISLSTTTSVSPAAAGSAVAAGSGVGSGTVVAGAGAGLLATVGGALVLNDTEDDKNDDPIRNLSGQWQGTWQDTQGRSGTISMSLSQQNDHLSGQVLISNSPCLSTGTVSGSISGDHVSLTIQSGTDSATMDTELTTDNTYMNGELAYTSGECEGDTTDVDARLTASAVVHW